MVRRFIDLKVRLESKTEEELISAYQEAVEAGYWAISVCFDPSEWGPEADDLVRRLRGEGINIYSTVEVDSSDPLWRSTLAKLRPLPDYLTVKVSRLTEGRLASLIKIVDGITLMLRKESLAWDYVSAREAARLRKVVSVDIQELLSEFEDPARLSAELRILKLELEISRRARLPIVAESMGAKSAGFIQPLLVASLLETLLGLEWNRALNSISSYPQSLLSGDRRLALRGYRTVEG
mgnify:CR=1 FL=1